MCCETPFAVRGRIVQNRPAGLVASMVPTALLFTSLEGLRVSLSWPMVVFLSGFMVAGVAAWISGRALLAATLRHEEAA